MYENEVLDEGYDDGTMPDNVDQLRQEVVGHKIVDAGWAEKPHWYGSGMTQRVFQITLDNGKQVILRDTDDCCAYTELEDFFLHVDKIDHIITGVGTTEGFSKWHVYADLGDVLELTVGWSSGNPFYYGYGFSIAVEDADLSSV
jgi:hypothetical protein